MYFSDKVDPRRVRFVRYFWIADEDNVHLWKVRFRNISHLNKENRRNKPDSYGKLDSETILKRTTNMYRSCNFSL